MTCSMSYDSKLHVMLHVTLLSASSVWSVYHVKDTCHDCEGFKIRKDGKVHDAILK